MENSHLPTPTQILLVGVFLRATGVVSHSVANRLLDTFICLEPAQNSPTLPHPLTKYTPPDLLVSLQTSESAPAPAPPWCPRPSPPKHHHVPGGVRVRGSVSPDQVFWQPPHVPEDLQQLKSIQRERKYPHGLPRESIAWPFLVLWSVTS